MQEKISFILKATLTIFFILFFYVSYSFAVCSHVPLLEALAVMEGDAEVTVTTVPVGAWEDPGYYYELKPVNVMPTGALILFPGGNCDVRAYSPAARDIAAAGYLVLLIPMPDCQDIGGFTRADIIFDLYPEIDTWSIGGHSFGGVLAGWYIQDGLVAGLAGMVNNHRINGLVNWDTVPPGSLLDYGIKAVSIYRTYDGEALPDFEDYRAFMPADTVWVPIEGTIHEYFGWYGDNATDYDYADEHFEWPDPTISREETQEIIISETISFLDSLKHIPEALESVTADDGSEWELVSTPGFDNGTENMSVVAMAEYRGRLYAMTRNQAEGAEVWRTDGTGWEQVSFPGGETNGTYGNKMINNVWGRMIVFQDKLYFGFSSGLQGTYLGSTGAEIWRYDGNLWEPVISDFKDVDESGSITAIAGCADADGITTAQITDSSKAWTVDQWAGGTLQVVSGPGLNRKFDIIGNTVDTLTIQQNEIAGTGEDLTSETEFTDCAEKTYNNPFPVYSYTLGEVAAGDSYEIGFDEDENGFGDFWNKTITDMLIFDNKLYVSIGLNYEYGSQIWYTEDGDAWTVTKARTSNGGPVENSFGNYHYYPDIPDDPETHDVDETQIGYPNANKPVSSSLTNMTVYDNVLYAGGTGTSGPLGGCSRMAKLTEAGWELIVDVNVDANDTGTNESGFGDGMECDMWTGNFMPWSLETFNGMLMIGINSMGGLRSLYSEFPGLDDTDPFGNPTWKDSIGGDSDYAPGFGDPLNQIAMNLFPHCGVLYGGVVMRHVPEFGEAFSLQYGAPLYKSGDGLMWEVVTNYGFGDNDTVMIEAFAEFEGALYLSASKGASSTPSGLGGAKIYRMVTDSDSDGACNNVDKCPDQANPGQEDADNDGIGDVCDADTVYGTITGIDSDVQVHLVSMSCGMNYPYDKEIAHSEGYYSFGSIPDGSYVVLPTSSFYDFDPYYAILQIPQTEVQAYDFTASRFFDNSDGTVTDTLTNLIWLKDANCFGSQPWSTAASLVSGLNSESNDCDLRDGSVAGEWRLPTKEELQRLGTNPPATWYGSDPYLIWRELDEPFVNVEDYFYWSATVLEDNIYGAWAVSFLNGYTIGSYINDSSYVWPVRDGN